MYILLAGYPPYWKASNTTEGINEAVCKAQWNFEGSEVWKHVTHEVKEMIRGMMELDPTKRLNIKQCLAHSWMEKAPMEFSQRPLDETMQSLRSSMLRGNFKNMSGVSWLLIVSRCFLEVVKGMMIMINTRFRYVALWL